MARIIDAGDPAERSEFVAAGVQAVRRGGVVVAPDEGTYSLISDAFSSAGVERIRSLKGRSTTPLGVLVGKRGTVDGIAAGIPDFARDLMAAFWPGPLTLLLRQQPSLAWTIGGPGLAVRMPLHPTLLGIVAEVGPTAVSAANPAGYPPPTDMDTLDEQLDTDLVAVVLDAGELPGATRSTVVDATGDHPVIMRSGAVDADRIAGVCASLEVRPS